MAIFNSYVELPEGIWISQDIILESTFLHGPSSPGGFHRDGPVDSACPVYKSFMIHNHQHDLLVGGLNHLEKY